MAGMAIREMLPTIVGVSISEYWTPHYTVG